MKEDRFIQSMQEWSGVFARRTIHDFMAFAHEHGVSMPQINVLMRLYYRGPASILSVRQELYGSRAAASQMIDKLVQMDLVERNELPEDRRVKMIRLTETGQRMVEQGIAARRKWLTVLEEALSPEEREQYAAMLSRFTQVGKAMEEHEDQERPAEAGEAPE